MRLISDVRYGAAVQSVRMRELYMNGRNGVSGDTVAKAVAYFSPYIFWAIVSALCAGIWFLAG